jgi:hypothetical protein
MARRPWHPRDVADGYGEQAQARARDPSQSSITHTTQAMIEDAHGRG